jgi:hypothetical protein
MIRKYYLPLFLLGVIAVAGCHTTPKVPDVTGIPMTVTIQRFDRAFASLDTTRMSFSLAALDSAYPDFLPVYLEQIMNFGPYPDSGAAYEKEISAFLNGRDIRLLNDTVMAHFSHMGGTEKALEDAFRYVKYYFPDFRPPRVVTFISGLANYGAITAGPVLGIGLDMFLGEDFVPYTKVADPYPGYMLHQFAPSYIVPDCLKVLEQQMFPLPRAGTLLEEMIARGKQLYFLDKVMPYQPDSVKIGFTAAQLAWCHANEQFVWQYLVQNDLLYIHDQQRIMHYIGPGPSTQGMPPAAPGDIGSWIGWQIVRRYAEAKPTATVSEVMKTGSAQQLLAESGYHPH